MLYLKFLLFCCIAVVYAGTPAVEYAKTVLKSFASTSHLKQIAENPLTPKPFLDSLNGLAEDARPCKGPLMEPFRRTDGLCNNLRSPFKGAVLTPQRRVVANGFLDRREFPRTRGVDFSRLPSAREVSLRCFGREDDGQTRNLRRGNATQIVWHFGQLLGHEMTMVEPVKGAAKCCENFMPGMEHPDVHKENGACFPVETLYDPVFDFECMPFTRALSVKVNGVRHPVNGVTSFIDGSTVYGSSFTSTEKLRLKSQGLLKTFKGELPPTLQGMGPAMCRTHLLTRLDSCPQAGDMRLNIQPGLGALHTSFIMEHNRIAKKLFEMHREWTDEEIFQQTKKLVVAFMQKFTFKDFLPVILGPYIMDTFHLNKPFHYVESIDPTLTIEFSTAAFRFGHSMVNDFVKDFLQRDKFFVANEQGSLVPELLLSISRGRPQKVNELFTDEMRQFFLFNVSVPEIAPPNVHFDVPARNIQRGRDTGLPPYLKYKKLCAKLLAGIPGVEQEVNKCEAYKDKKDIDLFAGGLAEMPVAGSLMGPTFACLNGLMFERLKFGDRFFYEGSGLEGFTYKQRALVERTTMAHLICALTPESRLQRDVFRPVSASNPEVPCRRILKERKLDDGLKTVGTSPSEESKVQKFFSFLRTLQLWAAKD